MNIGNKHNLIWLNCNHNCFMLLVQFIISFGGLVLLLLLCVCLYNMFKLYDFKTNTNFHLEDQPYRL